MAAPYLFPIDNNGASGILEYYPEIEAVWPELVTGFRKHNITLPFLFNSPGNQLEQLFYLACKEIGAPAITTGIYNVPLARAMFEVAKPDAIVVEDSISNQFLNTVSDNFAVKIKLLVVFSLKNGRPNRGHIDQNKFSEAEFLFLPHPLL